MFKKVLITALLSMATIIGGIYFYSRKNATPSQSIVDDGQQVQKVISQLHLDLSKFTPDALAVVNNELKPRTLKNILNINQYKTTKIFNIEFRSPWGEGVEISETKNKTLLKGLRFPNGVVLTVTHTSANLRDELIKEFGSLYIQPLQKVLGNKMNSNYDFLYYIYSSTPSQLNLQMSLENAQAKYEATILKGSMAPSSSQLYSFETDVIKGFQFGDYNVEHYILIQSFTSNGERYDFITDPKYNVNQDDIDTILSSLTVASS